MPQRWVIHIQPEEETLGQLLSRLRRELGEREGRELSQAEVVERAGMPNLQALLSKYELGRVAFPEEDHLRRLERVYGLRPETLSEAAVRTQMQKRRTKPVIPGRAIAVAAEPGMEDLLKAVTQLEQEQLALSQQFAEFLASTNLPTETPRERAETIAAFLAFQKEKESADEGTIG